MTGYLRKYYDLSPIDMIKLNKEKLAYMYNNSDLDALNYMDIFCEGEWKGLCKRLLELNELGDFDIPEYYNGKWKLLEHFGIQSDLGNAVVPEMEQTKFEALKEFIKGLLGKYDTKDLVAEVHNIYQEYLISEKQECELYKLVDPDDKEDSPAELWYSNHGCTELWDYVNCKADKLTYT